MRLSLSTAASPGVALDALDAACRARGLDGIEVVVGANARVAGARVVALRAERFDENEARSVARLSGHLDVPVSVPFGSYSIATLARVFAEEGGRVLFGFPTELQRVVELVTAIRAIGSPPSIGVAWDVRPSSEDLRACGAVLLAAHEHLGLVRLHGGGPEQRDQDGRGVGPLFVDLAISGYGGPIVLTPSSTDEVPRWREWLSSRKSAGCGKAHPAGEHELDVRDVEPRDRLGTILGAFRALPRGATLRITLDHDPSCMYYALEESEPAGTFAFRKVGDGPEVWGAEVTKQ